VRAPAPPLRYLHPSISLHHHRVRKRFRQVSAWAGWALSFVATDRFGCTASPWPCQLDRSCRVRPRAPGVAIGRRERQAGERDRRVAGDQAREGSRPARRRLRRSMPCAPGYPVPARGYRREDLSNTPNRTLVGGVGSTLRQRAREGPGEAMWRRREGARQLTAYAPGGGHVFTSSLPLRTRRCADYRVVSIAIEYCPVFMP
jgi:hypothetical protein